MKALLVRIAMPLAALLLLSGCARLEPWVKP
jgi:uncharacterized lipoprotein YajG